MAKLSIFDDNGVFNSIEITESKNIEECATELINGLIDWSEDDAESEEVYSADDNNEHINELEELKEEIENYNIDLTEQIWYVTNLGFKLCYDK